VDDKKKLPLLSVSLGAKMSEKPGLKVVKPARNGNAPPRTLGHHGQSLWNRVLSEYDVSDVAGQELLALACQSLDRAEVLREAIDRDGELLVSRTGGLREHPGIKPELANRAFVVKTLTKLGLDLEPLRAGPGRPPHPGGWSPIDDERGAAADRAPGRNTISWPRILRVPERREE